MIRQTLLAEETSYIETRSSRARFVCSKLLAYVPSRDSWRGVAIFLRDSIIRLTMPFQAQKNNGDAFLSVYEEGVHGPYSYRKIGKRDNKC
jgi:hypothetical protein